MTDKLKLTLIACKVIVDNLALDKNIPFKQKDMIFLSGEIAVEIADVVRMEKEQGIDSEDAIMEELVKLKDAHERYF